MIELNDFRKENMLKFLYNIFENKQISEMSISKDDFETVYGEKIDTWIEHLTKVLIYGNKSASWYEAIWKSGCNLCKKPFKHNKKYPKLNDLYEYFIYAGFGKDEYKKNPLKAIETRIRQEIIDVIDEYKKLDEDKNLIPRELNWSIASKNIKNFIEDYLKLILTRTDDCKLCYDLIDKYISVEQK